MDKLINRPKKRKEVKVIVNGLYDAGKTSILHRLRSKDVKTVSTNTGFDVETLTYRNLDLITFDVGGRDKVRPLWRHFLRDADAVIFVVDSADRDRINDAKRSFERDVLSEEDLRDCILSIAANKQDLRDALSPIHIQDIFEVNKIRKTRMCEVFPVSTKTDEGLFELLDWICRKRDDIKFANSEQSNQMIGYRSIFSSPTEFVKRLFSRI